MVARKGFKLKAQLATAIEVQELKDRVADLESIVERLCQRVEDLEASQPPVNLVGRAC